MSVSEQLESWMSAAGCTQMKPSGDNIISTCPFHNDTHRSFSVNSKTGKWICFSESCGMQGGLISFLVNGVGMSAKRAVKLADSFITSPTALFDDKWAELPDWKSKNTELADPGMPERLVALYEFCPAYLRKRGFIPRIMQKWEIGYDFEGKRITLPVRDSSGRLVGISKRATDNQKYEKYLHLNFKKSQYLYGEHLNPSARCVWVGEGQLDAIALYQMAELNKIEGVDLCVATMGARVSKTQIDEIMKYDSVVLAFDNDRDGIQAASKIGEAMLAEGRCPQVACAYPDGIKDPGDLLGCTTIEQLRFFSELAPFDLVRLSGLWYKFMVH